MMERMMVLVGLLVFATVCDAVRILPSSRIISNRTHESSERVLQSVYVAPPKSPDDHLVGMLPLQKEPFPTQHWAGHLPASGSNDKYFFYWLFEPETPVPADAPLLIWLNGGPACSSMDGLFIENGPLRLVRDPTDNNFVLSFSPHSWHKAPAYTLYIDQPVGTGLSFTTSKMYPRNDQEVNTDLYYFLQEFFKLHSDKFVTAGVMNRDLFFSGESYAGHYIPSIMNYMMKRKDTAASNGQISIPVRGAAIGNGWVDPFYQYAGADFAFGQGLIGMSQVATFKEDEKKCQAMLNQGNYNARICFDLIDDILSESHGGAAPTKASGYDIRKTEIKHVPRDFPPGHKVIETYLGGHALPANEVGKMPARVWEEVLKALHATAATAAGQTYEECTDPPYNALAGKDGLGVVDDVVQLLQHPDQVQLLFFNGIFDIICNHVGNEVFLEKLPWDHSDHWVLAERYSWFGDSSDKTKVSGYMKEFQNLKYLKIMGAGHMVPMDVPEVAFNMIQTFMQGGSFKQFKQDLDSTKQQDSCRVCPTCYERDSGAQPLFVSEPARSNGAGEQGGFSKYLWNLAGIAIGSFLTAIFLRRRSKTLGDHNGYDMELHELDPGGGGSPTIYKDEPNGFSEQNRVV